MTTIMKENVKWCAENNIRWLPVLIRINADGKKEFLCDDMARILHYKPAYTDFVKSPEAEIAFRMDSFARHYNNWKKRADATGGYWVMALDTHDTFIIDVDDPSVMPIIQPLLENHPYYLSTSKKLPKVFVSDSKMAIEIQKNNVKFHGGKIEVQKGQWSYLDMETPIHKKAIPDLDVMSVVGRPDSPTSVIDDRIVVSQQPATDVPVDFINHRDTFKLCRCLKPGRFDIWDDWFKIACAIKSDGNFLYNYEIWRYWSSQSGKYLPENYEEGGKDFEVYQKITTKTDGATLGSLHFMAKEDNEELYMELFGRNYDYVKTRIEHIIAKILSPTSYIIIKDRNDDENDPNDDGTQFDIVGMGGLFERFCEEYFLQKVVNKKDETTTERVDFMPVWRKDAKKRVYDKVVFDPRPIVNPRYYNLFHGLRGDQIGGCYRQEYVDEVNQFLLTQWCDGNVDVLHFIQWWFGQIVQYPYLKTRVLLIIKGIQGSGKGMFTDFMGNKVIGRDYYQSEADASKILARFNRLLENKLLVNFNEISMKDTIDSQGKSKSYITDDRMSIEPKGKDSYTIANHSNFIATTNASCPFYVEFSDRRFMCHESHAHALTSEQINHYKDFFMDNDVAFSYFQFLKNLELPKQPLEKIRPMTPFYKECRMVCATPTTMWWVYKLENDKGWETEPIRISTHEAFDEYEEWSKKYHRRSEPLNFIKFSTFYKKYPDTCMNFGKITDKNDKRVNGVCVYPIIFKEYLRSLFVMEDDNLPEV